MTELYKTNDKSLAEHLYRGIKYLYDKYVVQLRQDGSMYILSITSPSSVQAFFMMKASTEALEWGFFNPAENEERTTSSPEAVRQCEN
jgi:hypothetical protein